jgi:Ni,Fe-hydrogenase III small subunit/NAD-dependent dihydropyrimidine dehydrogenase PreA subunit
MGIADLLLRPLRSRVVTSRYPREVWLPERGARGLPEFDPARCTLTGSCEAVCPTGAIAIDIDIDIDGAETAPGQWSIDFGRCLSCGACVQACLEGAIRTESEIDPVAPTRQSLVRTWAVGEAGGRVPWEASESELERTISTKLRRSLHIRHLDSGSCNGCDWEMNTLLNSVHDLQRLGVDFVASPRHADMLLVTGAMTRNLAQAARLTYEAMPEPRLVVAIGACAAGGIFGESYATAGGIEAVLPVDIFISGCPPRPESLIRGLLAAVGRMPTTEKRPTTPGAGS